MDPNDRKFMPPNGLPLSFTETLILQAWIDEKLDASLAITDDRLSQEVKRNIQQNIGLDANKKPFYEKLKLPAISQDILSDLKDNGFLVKKLSGTLNLLDVKALDSLTKEKLELLSTVKEHIIWLDFSNAAADDSTIEGVADFENLVRLDLHGNPITDISSLTELSHLEVLNLHTTKVDNNLIGEIEKFKSLKSLYLWQSEFDENAIDSLRNAYPGLEVNFGSRLEVLKAKTEVKK